MSHRFKVENARVHGAVARDEARRVGFRALGAALRDPHIGVHVNAGKDERAVHEGECGVVLLCEEEGKM